MYLSKEAFRPSSQTLVAGTLTRIRNSFFEYPCLLAPKLNQNYIVFVTVGVLITVKNCLEFCPLRYSECTSVSKQDTTDNLRQKQKLALLQLTNIVFENSSWITVLNLWWHTWACHWFWKTGLSPVIQSMVYLWVLKLSKNQFKILTHCSK